MRSTCGGGGGGPLTRCRQAENSFLRKWHLIRDLKDGERSSSSRGTDGANTLRCVEAEQVQQKKIKVWRWKPNNKQRKGSWQLMLLIKMRVKISRCLSKSNIDWIVNRSNSFIFMFLIAHSHVNLSSLRRVRMDMRKQLGGVTSWQWWLVWRWRGDLSKRHLEVKSVKFVNDYMQQEWRFR